MLPRKVSACVNVFLSSSNCANKLFANKKQVKNNGRSFFIVSIKVNNYKSIVLTLMGGFASYLLKATTYQAKLYNDDFVLYLIYQILDYENKILLQLYNYHCFNSSVIFSNNK